MKKQIILLVLLLVILGLLYVIFGNNINKTKNIENNLEAEQGAKIRNEMSQVGCPDEMIVNKMPSVIDDSGVIPPPKAYYIKDGKRVEMADYDAVWVNANCEVPVLEVQ